MKTLDTCAGTDVTVSIDYNTSWAGICDELCVPPNYEPQCSNNSIVTITAGANRWIVGGGYSCVGAVSHSNAVSICDETRYTNFKVHKDSPCSSANETCSFRINIKCTECTAW